jgi:hypothetical protein
VSQISHKDWWLASFSIHFIFITLENNSSQACTVHMTPQGINEIAGGKFEREYLHEGIMTRPMMMTMVIVNWRGRGVTSPTVIMTCKIGNITTQGTCRALKLSLSLINSSELKPPNKVRPQLKLAQSSSALSSRQHYREHRAPKSP